MTTDAGVRARPRLHVVSPPPVAGPAPEAGCQTGLRVRVLEVVSVSAGGAPAIVVGSLQQKTLLTFLVAAQGRSVALDTIADELWPDEKPRRWRGCIATLANSLRKTVGDSEFIFCTARGYTLHRRPGIVQTDVEELQVSVEQARRAEADDCGAEAERFARAALATYGTGPWITDYWGWNEAAADAARILATALVRRGAYVACIAELSRAMEDFEWHDALWACLIHAHHQLRSTRRAVELTQRAKRAVGGVTPLLANVERQLSAGHPGPDSQLWAPPEVAMPDDCPAERGIGA